MQRAYGQALEMQEALEAFLGRGLLLRALSVETLVAQAVGKGCAVQLDPCMSAMPLLHVDLAKAVGVLEYALTEVAASVGGQPISILCDTTLRGLDLRVLPVPLSLACACDQVRISAPPLLFPGALGLTYATVRQWMLAMGGELRLLSLPSGLPVFLLTFPLAKAEARTLRFAHARARA